MHGQAETRLGPRASWVVAHLAVFALSAWLLAGGIEVVTGTPAGNPGRRLLLAMFGAVLWLRMTLTALYLLRRRMGWEEAAGVVCAVALYQVGFALAGASESATLGAIDVAAVALFVGGSALNTGAELQRRRFKDDPRNAGRLFTSGVFGIARHPNYLGDILWLLGWAMLTRQAFALAIPVVVGAAFALVFAPTLSRYLGTRYGEQYTAWAHRTPALVPGAFRLRDGWRRDRVLVLQRAAGITYLVAGLAKPFGNALAPGVPEDVGEVLRAAAAANAGTPLEAVSAALAANSTASTWFVMSAMVALGLIYLADRWLVRAAAVGNVAMLLCFAIVLMRHAPWLPLIDAWFMVLAIFIFRRATRRSRPAVTTHEGEHRPPTRRSSFGVTRASGRPPRHGDGSPLGSDGAQAGQGR